MSENFPKREEVLLTLVIRWDVGLSFCGEFFEKVFVYFMCIIGLEIPNVFWESLFYYFIFLIFCGP